MEGKTRFFSAHGPAIAGLKCAPLSVRCPYPLPSAEVPPPGRPRSDSRRALRWRREGGWLASRARSLLAGRGAPRQQVRGRTRRPRRHLLRSQPAPGLSRVTPRFSAARAHPFSFMLGCFALLVLLDSCCLGVRCPVLLKYPHATKQGSLSFSSARAVGWYAASVDAPRLLRAAGTGIA